MDKLKLHLPIYDITLEADKSAFTGDVAPRRVPAVREIRVIGGESFKGLQYFDLLFSIELDERMYNSIRIIGVNYNLPIVDILKKKFNDFKKTNPSYGTYSISNIGNSIDYLGTQELYLEDFFDYLKSDSRDLLISNILEDEKTK